MTCLPGDQRAYLFKKKYDTFGLVQSISGLVQSQCVLLEVERGSMKLEPEFIYVFLFETMISIILRGLQGIS